VEDGPDWILNQTLSDLQMRFGSFSPKPFTPYGPPAADPPPALPDALPEEADPSRGDGMLELYIELIC